MRKKKVLRPWVKAVIKVFKAVGTAALAVAFAGFVLWMLGGAVLQASVRNHPLSEAERMEAANDTGIYAVLHLGGDD